MTRPLTNTALQQLVQPHAGQTRRTCRCTDPPPLPRLQNAQEKAARKAAEKEAKLASGGTSAAEVLHATRGWMRPMTSSKSAGACPPLHA
eukprot:scaffold214385_cov29-Tisochrysis_lutea.AAC.2